MNTNRVRAFLEEMKPVVIDAGKKYVEPRFSGKPYEIDFEANPNDPANYVTATDRHISGIALARSREVFPGSYSEEDTKDRRYSGPISVWDPVDGTGGFVDELYESCGTLGVVLDEHDRPVGALAYAPETRCFMMADELGFIYFEIDGINQDIKEPADHIVAIQRTEAWNPKLDRFLEWFGKRRKVGVEVIEGGGPGSFGASFGRYDANLFSGTVGIGNWKEWDVAPLYVLLGSAGWNLSDLRGNKHTFNNYDPRYFNGFLATRLNHLGIMHEDIVRGIAEFTEIYRNELIAPGHGATNGTIMVTDQIYKDWKASERRAEWLELVKTIPSRERHRHLKRVRLV